MPSGLEKSLWRKERIMTNGDNMQNFLEEVDPEAETELEIYDCI